MQQYEWSGRGLLQGVYSAKQTDDKGTKGDVGDLASYRMFDENGSLLAEFDGTQFLQTSTTLKLTKLPRLVNVSTGISLERDEIHLAVGLGTFATLDLITRYTNLNATSLGSPESGSAETQQTIFQTRKELRVKDLVGSTSIVIDVSSKKIVEKNASEPFGLARDVPLISNSVISDPQQSWGFERREPLKAVLKHEPPKGDWT